MTYFQDDERKVYTFLETREFSISYHTVFHDEYSINEIARTLAIDDAGNASEILDFFTFCNQSETTVSNDTAQDEMHQNGIGTYHNISIVAVI